MKTSGVKMQYFTTWNTIICTKETKSCAPGVPKMHRRPSEGLNTQNEVDHSECRVCV